jgi:hypothetical protein
MQSIQQLVHPWKRVAVLDSDLVEPTEIDTETVGTVFLSHKQDRRAERRATGANQTQSKQFVQLLSQVCKLVRGHAVQTTVRWRNPWLQYDIVIHRTLGRVRRLEVRVGRYHIFKFV